ncbi:MULTISPECIES: hypothetical protein [Glutamicibacter]|uniref:hypothetical protein n=1 Tax=Glutamicibacter TaxID=1742989 RepID=UPI00257D377E|nr:hypothetical protein [Glutamicibacter sp.]
MSHILSTIQTLKGRVSGFMNRANTTSFLNTFNLIISVSLIAAALVFAHKGAQCTGMIKGDLFCISGQSSKHLYAGLWYFSAGLFIYIFILVFFFSYKARKRTQTARKALQYNHNLLGWLTGIGVVLTFTVSPFFDEPSIDPENQRDCLSFYSANCYTPPPISPLKSHQKYLQEKLSE